MITITLFYEMQKVSYLNLGNCIIGIKIEKKKVKNVILFQP